MIHESISCEICSSRPAKLVVFRRRHDDLRRTFVCMDCANEHARFHSNASLDFERILTQINIRSSANVDSYSCKLCGMTLAEIVVDGKPGCCLCYLRFGEEIGQAIETAQKNTFHLGKAPIK